MGAECVRVSPTVGCERVRQWEATKERKRREPVFRKSVDTERGKLTFTNLTKLDPEHQQLVVSETHTLLTDRDAEHSSHYQFVMRCWSLGEVGSALASNGFGMGAYFGAYDPRVEAGVTDRLVAVARLEDPVGVR